MQKIKRIMLVALGIGILSISAIMLILNTKVETYEKYASSLKEEELTTISMQSGDFIIVKTDKMDDIASIIKIFNSKDKLVASSQSQLGEGVNLLFTVEETDDYKIVITLDNPDTEVDGVINISIQQFSSLILILFGALFIFASVVVVSSSLLREQFIMPSVVLKDKKQFGALKPSKEVDREREIPVEQTEFTETVTKKDYKALIEPANQEIIKAFVERIYNGISTRADLLDAYAIDLKNDTIIWNYTDQKEKPNFEFSKTPTKLKDNRGVNSLFQKILGLYGGLLPSQIVLSFPNYYLNGLLHKQVLVLVLLKPEVDWGISSSIFKK